MWNTQWNRGLRNFFADRLGTLDSWEFSVDKCALFIFSGGRYYV